MNLITERYYWHKKYPLVIGIDEAGRGSLAGPVVAAAVAIKLKIKNKKSKLQIKNKNFKEILKKVRDSKKLSPQKREEIFKLIKASSEIKFAYTFVSEKVIDKINIEQATFLAMKKSLKKLKVKPDLILVDGNRLIPKIPYPQKAIVKGDDKVFSIALASVIAKVIRDKKMITLARRYPRYQFEIHKGYGTKLHLDLLKKYGPSPLHRHTYKPLKNII